MLSVISVQVIKANNASRSAASDPVSILYSSIMARNGTVFLAALTSQAPSKSKVAISVHNISAISAGVINRTPTMTPSEKPVAPSKADDGDTTTVVIVVVVVVGGAVLLGVLLAIWFRFYTKRNSSHQNS